MGPITTFLFLRIEGSFQSSWISSNNGIVNPENKYNNVLGGVFYNDIPQDILNNTPLHVMFNFVQLKGIIYDLDLDYDDPSTIGNEPMLPYNYRVDPKHTTVRRKRYWLSEINIFEASKGNYYGNWNTYFCLTKLIPVYLNRIILLTYKNNCYTINELIKYFEFQESNILINKSVDEWIEYFLFPLRSRTEE